MKRHFLRVVIGAAVLTALCAAAAKEKKLVVYCSVDETWAAPLFEKFTKATGIRIAAAYDTEANKSVGLSNRLLAERATPVCDVYWCGEPVQMQRLAESGTLLPYTNLPVTLPAYYAKWPQPLFLPNAFRQRVMVVNTNRLPNASAWPRSPVEMTNAVWRGNAGYADPRFGSTLLEFAVLYQQMGETAFKDWYRALRANKAHVFTGNSRSVQAAREGSVAWSLTDNDDVMHELADGAPIAMIESGMYFPYGLCIIKKPTIKTNEVTAFIQFMIGKEVLDALCGTPPYFYHYRPETVLQKGSFTIKLDTLSKNHAAVIKAMQGL